MIGILEHVDRFKAGNPFPESVRDFLRADGTGTENIIGNHAATAQAYYYACPEDRLVFVHEIIGFILDTTVGWSAVKYGAITLSNGYLLRVVRGEGAQLEVIHDFQKGRVVKTNGDLHSHVHRIRFPAWTGTIDSLSALYALGESGAPQPMRPGERIELIANDDFSGLDVHTWKIIGCAYQIEDNGSIQPPVGQ